jgi:hypothetical protein
MAAGALRWHQALYSTGGQDQGVYVLNSALLERTGTQTFEDKTRLIFEKYGLAGYYDRFNQYSLFTKVENKYEGTHRPGFYLVRPGLYTGQFYPLHPIWMAHFAQLFGQGKQQYSLVLFAIISILSLSLITYEMSDHSMAAGLTVGVLLAISPWHVYFSRFPLTEIVALAMTSSAFYQLLIYWRRRRDDGELEGWRLGFSAMIFGCYLFTRISGIVYLPFIFVIACAEAFLDQDGPRRRQMMMYFFSIAVLYSCSLGYGYLRSFPYFYDVHVSLLTGYFGKYWKVVTPLFVAGLFVTVVTLVQSHRIKSLVKLREWVEKWASMAAAAVFLLVLAGCLYIVYLLKIGAELDDRVRWMGAAAGFEAVRYSVLYVVGQYFWILLPLAFVASIGFAAQKRRAEEGFLLGVLALGWYYAGYKQQYIPYQYYGIRYMVMELLPYTLLAAVLFLATWWQSQVRWRRWLAAFCVLATAIHSGKFTLPQMNGVEYDEINQSLKQLVKRVGHDDILLVQDITWELGDAVAGLEVFYGMHVAVIDSDLDLTGVLAPLLANHTGKVFLFCLRPNRSPYLRDEVALEMSLRRMYQESGIPRDFERLKYTWYLYSVDVDKVRNEFVLLNSVASESKDLGWEFKPARSVPEVKGESIVRIGVDSVSRWSRDKNPPLQVFIDGKPAEFLFFDPLDPGVVFTLPKGMKSISSLRLDGFGKANVKVRSAMVMRKERVVFGHGERGLRGAFTDGWLGGHSLKENIDIPVRGFKHLVLETHGFHPFLRDLAKFRPRLYINGIEAAFVGIDHFDVIFDLPASLMMLSSLSLKIDPFVPASFNIGADQRKLGLDVNRVILR